MKIHLNKIPFDHLETYMTGAWMDDQDLVEKYHVIAPATLEECVQDTLRNIREYGKQYGLEYYSVEIETEMDHRRSMIGFTVLIGKPAMLYSFGIRKSYRKRFILEHWLDAVKKKFARMHFTVPLYHKNTRAIDFFRRNGFNNSKEQDKFVLLWQ